jgi:hypothetical protein
MKTPNWLYAWMAGHSEKNIAYGFRPRFVIVILFIVGVIWWATVKLLSALVSSISQTDSSPFSWAAPAFFGQERINEHSPPRQHRR